MNDEITIVSGLPRSGTSMMMKMLEAGGMSVAIDNERKADEDNPKGYYEYEKVKEIKHNASWLDGVQGKVVKMVSMLLFDLPRDKTFKVIFMRRDLDEMLASQKVMLGRKGDSVAVGDEEMKNLYEKHLADIGQWLSKQPYLQVLYVHYREVIDEPRTAAERIEKFVKRGLNIGKMTDVVDKSLYRQKSTKRPLDKSQDRPDEDKASGSIKEEDRQKIESQLKSLGYM